MAFGTAKLIVSCLSRCSDKVRCPHFSGCEAHYHDYLEQQGKVCHCIHIYDYCIYVYDYTCRIIVPR